MSFLSVNPEHLQKAASQMQRLLEISTVKRKSPDRLALHGKAPASDTNSQKAVAHLRQYAENYDRIYGELLKVLQELVVTLNGSAARYAAGEEDNARTLST